MIAFVIDKTLYIDGGEYTTRNGSVYAQYIRKYSSFIRLSFTLLGVSKINANLVRQ